MPPTQYGQFRNLDRRCVGGGFDDKECREAVSRKRALIDFNRMNSVVQPVIAGERSFVETYVSHSRAFRGYRRFLPHRADEEANQELEDLSRIVPNVGHFARRGIFAADNPVTCAFYGAALSLTLALFWAGPAGGSEGWGDSDFLGANDMQLSFTLLGPIFGFLLGLFSMFKYRTRDLKRIHAREAAIYMDANYAYYRNGDDVGWAKLIAAGKPPEHPPAVAARVS